MDFEEPDCTLSPRNTLVHTTSAATANTEVPSGATAREKSISTVKCGKCGHETEMATPTVKLCMKSYFAGILEVKKDRVKIRE